MQISPRNPLSRKKNGLQNKHLGYTVNVFVWYNLVNQKDVKEATDRNLCLLSFDFHF